MSLSGKYRKISKLFFVWKEYLISVFVTSFNLSKMFWILEQFCVFRTRLQEKHKPNMESVGCPALLQTACFFSFFYEISYTERLLFDSIPWKRCFGEEIFYIPYWEMAYDITWSVIGKRCFWSNTGLFPANFIKNFRTMWELQMQTVLYEFLEKMHWSKH